MTRILGIDPGSRVTGFGVVDSAGDRLTLVECGCLKLPTVSFPQRLKLILEGLGTVVERLAPAEAAVEQVFVSRNPDSALKLGQARGAAICALVSRDLAVAEYTPAEIKQAVVGGGRADKAQVQRMVAMLLNLKEPPASDAADALARA